MGKLIIDGNSVYEIDEECLKKRKISPACGIEQALKKQAEREKKKKSKNEKEDPLSGPLFDWICLADASAATTTTAAVSA